MVHGAAAAGKRAMTTSSSPGISLMQEGISYMAGTQLPAVIVNVQRGGPGLGNIAAAQGDYFQATRGGGNGDYRTIVLAPDSAQEMLDFTFQAFDLADQYRTPVMVLSDGRLGQMMEPVELRDPPAEEARRKALGADRGQGPRPALPLLASPARARTGRAQPGACRRSTARSSAASRAASRTARPTPRWCSWPTAPVPGSAARPPTSSATKGLKAGLFRPITLWPFPDKKLSTAVKKARTARRGGNERRADGRGRAVGRLRPAADRVSRIHGRRGALGEGAGRPGAKAAPEAAAQDCIARNTLMIAMDTTD